MKKITFDLNWLKPSRLIMIEITTDHNDGELNLIFSTDQHDDITTLIISQTTSRSPYRLVMATEKGAQTEIGYIENGVLALETLRRLKSCSLHPGSTIHMGRIIYKRGREILSAKPLKVRMTSPVSNNRL